MNHRKAKGVALSMKLSHNQTSNGTVTVPQQMASCCGQGHTQTAGLLSRVWQKGTWAGTTSWHVVSQNLEHQSWWGTCVSVLIPFHRTKATPPVKTTTNHISLIKQSQHASAFFIFKYYLQMLFTSFWGVFFCCHCFSFFLFSFSLHSCFLQLSFLLFFSLFLFCSLI